MLMQFKGLLNLFACMECSVRETKSVKCDPCGSFLCEHLVVYLGGGECVCFLCRGYEDDPDEWPDWSYTMVPESRPSRDEG
jgi:hypothetical protein